MTRVVRLLTGIALAIAIALAGGLGLFILSGWIRDAIPGEFEDPRLKVAIIDTGLDLTDPRFKTALCRFGHRDFTGEGLRDQNGHGTHIAGIIAERVNDFSKVCIVILKYYRDEATGTQNMNREVQAIKHAATIGARVVNISGGGPEFEENEFTLIKDNPQITFSVAAGNEGQDVTDPEHYFYPGSYRLPNVHRTANYDCVRKRPGRKSNYAPGIDWRCGTEILSTLPEGKRGYQTGTSQAAAIYTAELINRMIGEVR